MKKLALIAIAAGFTAVAPAQEHAPTAPAFAPPNLTPRGVASMAAGCAICHGSHGNPAPGSIVARLAGSPAQATSDALKAFRDGRREATVMHQIAKGFNDAEIAALAEYFARQPVEGS